MKRACITGGAGFIGSTLADRLSADGAEVNVVDDFRTGRREFVADLLERPGTKLFEGDVLDDALMREAVRGCDWVFHLQANADVRHGLDHPRRDLEQNTIATSTVLEAMRAEGVTRIGFSSTGSVYGEPEVFPTPEDAPFPLQTSLYAASKLAGEGMIGAYAHGYDFTGLIFRFVSILGERYTHGHVFDFYRALRTDPSRLRVLGDGRQEKSYLYIGDCVEAIITAVAAHEDTPGETNVYNLGTDETIVVDNSIAPDRRPHRAQPRGRTHRRQARLEGRLAADPARLREDPRPRLGTHLDHRAGDRADPRLVRGQPRDRPGTGRERVVSVIFSRAPLRISLGGGGTDLPSYYEEHGGFLVSGAIDKYVYMLTHTVFQRRYRMKYSDDRGGRHDRGDQAPDPARDAVPALARATRSRSPPWPTSRRGPGWAPRAPSPSA